MVDVLHTIISGSTAITTIIGNLVEFGDRLRRERERLGRNQTDMGDLGGVTRNSQSAYELGKTPPTIEYLWKIGAAGADIPYLLTGQAGGAHNDGQSEPLRRLIERATDQQKNAIARVMSPNVAEAEAAVAAEQLDVVPVDSVDQEYGMGATFADGPVQVDTYHFSRAWMDQVTPTAPISLTWARGRGDSMFPTIGDGEMVLIDRSDRRITDTDAIWAFTIGEFGYMKRLRVRGDQVTILSDNQNVPPDHATLGEINLIGRVSRVVKRL